MTNPTEPVSDKQVSEPTSQQAFEQAIKKQPQPMPVADMSTDITNIPADIKSYPVIYKQVIAWGHMDAFVHLNNVLYYRYAESARIQYLQRANIFAASSPVLLAHSSCTYLRPVLFPDTLLIGVRCKKLGNTSIVFAYEFYSETQQTIVATVEAVIVRMNEQQTQKQPWTDEERQRIMQIEASVGNSLAG